MATPRPKLSTLLPPVILGGGVYNTQMNPDPSLLPVRTLIARAFAVGITAIDTSPYYGPSEILIGDALKHSSAPRDSYLIMTKAGRIAEQTFDYSPAWIRSSVLRSLQRLNTTYLDVVFCHDTEFVTPEAVVEAVRTLFALADEGKIRYVGISGYPPDVLAELAVLIRQRLGRPVDVVQSYCHYNLQNGKLAEHLPRLKGEGGVDVVLNASPLSMKLLSGSYPGDFHPAPKELQERCVQAEKWCRERGESLAGVAMRWVFKNWEGSVITGASYVEELESNLEAFREVRGELGGVQVSAERLKRLEELWSGVRDILGEYVDWSWSSPPEGYVKWGEKVAQSKL